jgi:hypothetical protein
MNKNITYLYSALRLTWKLYYTDYNFHRQQTNITCSVENVNLHFETKQLELYRQPNTAYLQIMNNKEFF